ncbi:MAG: hypothetical protein COB35_04430 [Gammaproteobacteria bacterium]|nr:MAG: hypothetical protein COB35_04430 [Gammaproteobacteria bacterium]
MKLLIIILMMLLTACSEQKRLIDQDVVAAANIDQLVYAVQKAKEKKDYRLLAMKGRRITLPGFERQNVNEISQRCGIKLMKNTGDVLKNDEDRENRRLKYQFALNFNHIIFAICNDKKLQ